MTIQEIEDSLPSEALTAAERWLLYYSLHAAEIEIRDECGATVEVPPLSQAELEALAEERSAASGAQHEPAAGTPAASRPDNAVEPDEDVQSSMEEMPSHHP